MRLELSEDQSKLILKESSREEYNQLKHTLSPYVKNYRFMPRFKAGVWNGKMDFFKEGQMDFGLWKEVVEICKEYGYKFKLDNKENFPRDNSMTQKKVKDFCDDFFKNHKLPHEVDKNGKIIKEGDKFTPYDHQQRAVYSLLKHKFGLIEVATAGGKSFIFFTLMAYILRKINPNAKILLIVPNISLVTQFYDDILDYNIGYNNDNEDPLDLNILEIMSDKPRKNRQGTEPNVFIGTYQSLLKYPTDFFKQFDVVATDEAHTAKAVTVSKVLKKTCGYAKYRFGMSGTYPSEKTAELYSVESLMGPIIMVMKAKELQEKGLIAQLKIKSIQLDHDDFEVADVLKDLRKAGLGKNAYDLEVKYVHESEKRIKFLNKLVKRFKNPSLVLFNTIEYGKTLFNYFKQNIPELEFYYIDGKTKAVERDKIKKIMSDTSGKPKVLVASYGTLSTGVNIKAITNIVFADSFKSDQRIRQSIGRALRLHKDKEKAIIFDIVDRIHIKYKNALVNHYLTRRNEIYVPQEYPFDELNLKL